ncbi:MAG: hypothetical protein EOP86_20020 [Verrucomicrobiaceae bacterium]|nr:MAG: hypothetical protein EOP86_20020 [Verrucomicrobiaceae bacterium]
MNQENVLFNIFIELLVLSELHQELEEDEIGKIVESAAMEFEAQPGEVLTRFVDHCRTLLARERERGATDRAQVIECMMAHYQECGQSAALALSPSSSLAGSGSDSGSNAASPTLAAAPAPGSSPS